MRAMCEWDWSKVKVNSPYQLKCFKKLTHINSLKHSNP